MINEMLQNPIFKRGFDIGFSYRLAADEFDEELHPRDETGKFTSGGASSALAEHKSVTRELISTEKAVELANKIYNDTSIGAYASPKNGDMTGQIINEALGYDGLPLVLPPEEFEDLEPNKDYPNCYYRGVIGTREMSAEQMLDEFRKGDLYVGTGIYGNGTYIGDGFTAKEYATDMLSGKEIGKIMETQLLPDAKVADFGTIFEEYSRDYDTLGKTAGGRMMRNDVGYYAAMKGYDAIASNGRHNNDYIVVLNRTKLAVNSKNWGDD